MTGGETTAADGAPEPLGFGTLGRQAAALAAALMERGATLATAESCTGGLIGAVCTSLAGSSAWFERGFITYSNDAKTQSLGVPAALIAAHGAVSEEVAEAMATGALAQSRASVAVAVTGIAGPGGATPGKPVGTVWLAAASRQGTVRVVHRSFIGDRESVRWQTVRDALQLAGDVLA